MTASRAAGLRGTALTALREAFSSSAEASIAQGMVVLVVKPEDVLPSARKLRDTHGFDLLLDVTAIDWPSRQPRFDVVWHFYSTSSAVRVRMKTGVAEDSPEVDSLTGLYGAAGFLERECHDMYGIRFRGNGDLRPILLYEGFVGHPLRKDYPKEREQPLVPYREER